MCGRTIIIDTVETIEKRFNLHQQEINFEPNYNVSIGSLAPVITQDKPKQLQLFVFGLTPDWAKKPMYLFNARCEGDFNTDDNPHYTGGKGIITKPAFKKPIRSQRCLVIVSGFIEGPKDIGLSKPYLVFLRDHKRPFALAGIYDTWKNPETGEVMNGYSIVTTTANSLLQKIGHPRMPVILDQHNESDWLSENAPLADITRLLRPFDAEKMNAYPIDPKIKSPKVNEKQLLMPLGERVLPEVEIKFKTEAGYQGFGHGRKFKE